MLYITLEEYKALELLSNCGFERIAAMKTGSIVSHGDISTHSYLIPNARAVNHSTWLKDSWISIEDILEKCVIV